MALGTATVVKRSAADGPVRFDVISFAGDSAYSTGGTVFEAFVQDALGVGAIDILGIVPQETGGLLLTDEHATDKLKVWNFNYDASDRAAQEDPTPNQSRRADRVMGIS